MTWQLAQCIDNLTVYPNSLSPFNGHFPGEAGLAGVVFIILLKQSMLEVVVTKLQSNHRHQQTNTQFFTGRMPFLSPNQQCRSTEGENITFNGLAYPKLTWGLPTLCLTINSSWLPWGRVDMPLISPLMPIPQQYTQTNRYIKIQQVTRLKSVNTRIINYQ